MKKEHKAIIEFKQWPRIGNRQDALELLGLLVSVDSIKNVSYALEALKDAMEREVI
jgi:hypothetical protein